MAQNNKHTDKTKLNSPQKFKRKKFQDKILIYGWVLQSAYFLLFLSVTIRGLEEVLGIQSFFHYTILLPFLILLMIIQLIWNVQMSYELSSFELHNISLPIALLLLTGVTYIPNQLTRGILFTVILVSMFPYFLMYEYRRLKKYRIKKFAKETLLPYEKKLIKMIMIYVIIIIMVVSIPYN